MTLDRRAFLQSLASISVIASFPIRAELDPTELAQPAQKSVPLANLFDVKAPEGLTYNWVRSALLGEPDPENVKRRLDAGWTFVAPEAHPELAFFRADHALEGFGLILMQKPTIQTKRPEPWPIPKPVADADPLSEPDIDSKEYDAMWGSTLYRNYTYAKKVLEDVRNGDRLPPYNYDELQRFVAQYEEARDMGA